MPRVLVVDDETSVRESLRMLLKGDCDVVTADGAQAGLQTLAEMPVDLVMLDLVMPGMSGLDFLRALQERGDAPPVIVLTATKTVATAVEAMKLGAADYVTKPFEVDALRHKIRQSLEHRALAREVERLTDELEGRSRLGALVGSSESMRAVFHTIERVAPSPATVLIQGESGTGKELAARAIHELGPRAGGPFVAVNCAAIPESLVESELFGHERGAFTGAQEQRIGRFESASGGTLFLDEIGELGPTHQAKLLRAIQERSVERVGGARPISVDVRILAATNRDLRLAVEEGSFRADLFHRVNVVPLQLPPLRERRGDVALLARGFLQAARGEYGAGPARFERSALAALERHAWPGNVRELENAVQHAVALCEGDAIRVRDLPEAVVAAGRTESLRDDVREGALSFEQAVARFEGDLIREALARAGGNQTRASESLGITRRLLKLKMDRYGIES